MQPPPRPPSVSRLLSRARHAAHAARQSLFSAGTMASWDPVVSQYQTPDSAGPSSAPPPPPKPKKSEHLCALLEQAYVDLDPLPGPDRRTTKHTDSLRQVVNANLQRVMDIFHHLDTDDSGEVDRREFHTGILTLVGNEHPTSELDELFDTIDTSGDGRISYRELYRTIRGGVQSSTQPTATAALPMKPQALPQQAPQQQHRAAHPHQQHQALAEADHMGIGAPGRQAGGGFGPPGRQAHGQHQARFRHAQTEVLGQQGGPEQGQQGKRATG